MAYQNDCDCSNHKVKMFLSGRQTGKTTNLIKEAIKTGATLVSPTGDMAKLAPVIAKQAGLNATKLKSISMKDLLADREYHKNPKGYLFDDMIGCLNVIGPIKGISMLIGYDGIEEFKK